MELEVAKAKLDEGKVLQAFGDIEDRSGLMPTTVYVEWYVAKIGDVYVAVNDVNDAETLGCEDEFAILVEDMPYEERNIMEVGNTPYDREDFQEILDRKTCDCEEPIAFRAEHSLWSCGVCEKPLKDQDRESEDDE